MITNRVKKVMQKRILGIIRNHRNIYRITRKAYQRYQNPRLKREFRLRISQRDANEYLNVAQKPNLNVVLLVVDSLSNSHLSSQGYSRETTPFLDSFKSRFTTITASPWTYPSVPSILTGLYPHNHNAILSGSVKVIWTPETYLKLRDDVLTLPELLFFLGYDIYFGSAIGLDCDALGARIIPRRFNPTDRADDILNDLARWITKQRGERFFAYAQLGDLHPPLNSPNDFRNFFGDVKDLPNIDGWDFVKYERQKADTEKFKEYKENRQLLYDNILRYVDRAIEQFHNRLRERGLLDSTVFIITADHGEQFWEHAELDAENFYLLNGVCGISHGDNVYNEVIQVPLLISGPVPDEKPDHFVSTVDIMPTVVDLLGISHNMRFDGQNIFKADAERPLLSEAVSCGYEKKALIIDKYKLIYSKNDNIKWVFDLEKDPQEQHPIVDTDITAVFVQKLLHMLKEDEKRNIKEIARKKITL